MTRGEFENSLPNSICQDRPSIGRKVSKLSALCYNIAMHTVSKKEMIDLIAEKLGCKAVAVRDVLQKFLDEIIEELGRGNRLEFRDFGVFEIRPKRARQARNPRNGTQVMIPARRSVRFKIGRLMKMKMHEPAGPEIAR
ncbi:MAG: HU family DNA-binding protein [Planctomycetes bacterium]|nr:HU family DNA-binding protein [Planctomycetota bacterium]